jgi:hypothetical protein
MSPLTEPHQQDANWRSILGYKSNVGCPLCYTKLLFATTRSERPKWRLAAIRSSAGDWLAPAQRCRFTNPYEVCGATPRYLY